MTPAKGLFVAAILAVITLGGPAAAMSMTRPTIANFVKRHGRTMYLTQAAVWFSLAVFMALISQSRFRGWMVASYIAMAGLNIAIAMFVRHPRDTEQVDGS